MYHTLYNLNAQVAINHQRCLWIFTAQDVSFHIPSFGLNSCVCVKPSQQGTWNVFGIEHIANDFKYSLKNIPYNRETLRYALQNSVPVKPTHYYDLIIQLQDVHPLNTETPNTEAVINPIFAHFSKEALKFSVPILAKYAIKKIPRFTTWL